MSYVGFAFAILLTGCATSPVAQSQFGIASAAAKAVTASPEELKSLTPFGAKTEDCEADQRLFLFLSNLPSMQLAELANQALIQTRHTLGLTVKQNANITPCVRNANALETPIASAMTR